MVGVFDLASNVSEGTQLKCRVVIALLKPTAGIRNTTTVFDTPARERVRVASSHPVSDCRRLYSRQPRHTPADGVLIPYDARAANGQYFMKELNDGAYRKEFYVAHISRSSSSSSVMRMLLNTPRHHWGR